MKTRIKVSLPILTTRDDAEAAMNDLALAVNNQRKLTARRDAEVLAINTRYESPMGELSQSIKEKTDTLRAWADANPEQFPKGRKSLDLVSGTLGFRTGTPKLQLLSRAWNWEKVLDAIQLRGFQFVRTKAEVDKEAILGFVSAGPEPPAELEATVLRPIGVKIVQDESFFIEPNLTALETRQTSEAA